jgi:hypothetical protein
MDNPGTHTDDAYADYEPTTGSQQFWWLADSVPLGRQLVIAVLALGLVGIGFGIGRLGQKVVVQTVNVPILAPRSEPLPSASLAASPGIVLDATLQNPSAPQFSTPAYARFQPRLPWEEAPGEVDPALLAVETVNRRITSMNIHSMEEYVRRMRQSQVLMQRPASEVYYVTRRTPAYTHQARLGDKPLRYLMPGTPLHLESVQSRWARVSGPAGETMWIKASVLSMQKTHRST